jgi:hypothetical protein
MRIRKAMTLLPAFTILLALGMATALADDGTQQAPPNSTNDIALTQVPAPTAPTAAVPLTLWMALARWPLLDGEYRARQIPWSDGSTAHGARSASLQLKRHGRQHDRHPPRDDACIGDRSAVCDYVDLDGPIFLAQDRSPALTYRGGSVFCAGSIWGDGK